MVKEDKILGKGVHGCAIYGKPLKCENGYKIKITDQSNSSVNSEKNAIEVDLIYDNSTNFAFKNSISV
jgi:hypothetical protein